MTSDKTQTIYATINSIMIYDMAGFTIRGKKNIKN